jgi:hypothetical protein
LRQIISLHQAPRRAAIAFCFAEIADLPASPGAQDCQFSDSVVLRNKKCAAIRNCRREIAPEVRKMIAK